MKNTPLFQKFFIIVLIGVLAMPTLLPYVADAQEPQISQLNVSEQNDFVVEPGKVEAFLNRGETVVKSVMVTNRIKRKVRFNVVTEDFIGSYDPQQPVILLGNDKSPYSFKENLEPSVKEFTLDFGQRITIPVKITVPKDASPGGYYSSVVISNQPDKEELASSTTNTVAKNRIISRLGVLFFIRVNGDAKENGALEQFNLSGGGWFRQQGPVSFEILFSNSGTVHLVPYGMVTVTNLFGQKVASLPVDAYFSLPNSTRYRVVDWNKSMLLGRYKATLELNRGYGNVVDKQSIAFWVIPWKILVGAFAALFVIIALVYYIVTRFEFKRK